MSMRPLFLILFVLFSLIVVAKGKGQLMYEISCAGNSDGYYIVEVSAYVHTKREISEDVVKKCALHGILFKGFSGKDGCHSQRQMLANYNREHSTLIDKLIFKEYGKYTETIGIPLKVVKQSKRYKITTIVQVSKNLLRRDLEKAGIIRKLGF